MRDVSDDVAVADDNAFWFSGRAARKKQDRFPVAAYFWNMQKAQEQTCRDKGRHDPPENDLAFDSRQQFVQFQNMFRPRKIFESWYERRG